MMMTPNIHFTGQCGRAIELYKRAFGAEVRAIMRYADAGDSGYGAEYADFVYHAELFIGPNRLVMNDSPVPAAPEGNTVSIMMSLDSVTPAQAAYAALSENATVITPPCTTSYSDFFASLIDRFGVRWEIIVEK